MVAEVTDTFEQLVIRGPLRNNWIIEWMQNIALNNGMNMDELKQAMLARNYLSSEDEHHLVHAINPPTMLLALKSYQVGRTVAHE